MIDLTLDANGTVDALINARAGENVEYHRTSKPMSVANARYLRAEHRDECSAGVLTLAETADVVSDMSAKGRVALAQRKNADSTTSYCVQKTARF